MNIDAKMEYGMPQPTTNYGIHWQRAAPPDYPYAVSADAPSVLVCPGCGHDEKTNRFACRVCWVTLISRDPATAAAIRQHSSETARSLFASYFAAKIQPVYAKPRPSDGTLKSFADMQRELSMYENTASPDSFHIADTGGVTGGITALGVFVDTRFCTDLANYDEVADTMQQITDTMHRIENAAGSSLTGGLAVKTLPMLTMQPHRQPNVTAWELFSNDGDVVRFAERKAESKAKYAETLRRVWTRNENGWRDKYESIVRLATKRQEVLPVTEPGLVVSIDYVECE